MTRTNLNKNRKQATKLRKLNSLHRNPFLSSASTALSYTEQVFLSHNAPKLSDSLSIGCISFHLKTPKLQQ